MCNFLIAIAASEVLEHSVPSGSFVSLPVSKLGANDSVAHFGSFTSCGGLSDDASVGGSPEKIQDRQQGAELLVLTESNQRLALELGCFLFIERLKEEEQGVFSRKKIELKKRQNRTEFALRLILGPKDSFRSEADIRRNLENQYVIETLRLLKSLEIHSFYEIEGCEDWEINQLLDRLQKQLIRGFLLPEITSLNKDFFQLQSREDLLKEKVHAINRKLFFLQRNRVSRSLLPSDLSVIVGALERYDRSHFLSDLAYIFNLGLMEFAQ